MMNIQVMKSGEKARKRRLIRAGLAGLAALAIFAPQPDSARAFARDSTPQTSQGAAAGDPALDLILKELASYDYAQGIGPAAALREYVLARKDSPEDREVCEMRLAGFLESDVSPAGKMSVCRMLRLIGSGKSVPALSRMLLNAETNDMARFALEKIPGSEADTALAGALDDSRGALKIAIISSLGRRGAERAVPVLGKNAVGQDKDAARASIIALGQIGGKNSAAVLSPLLANPDSGTRDRAASALLLCAEGFKLEKDFSGASAIYEKILKGKLPLVIRQAAMKGKLSTAGGDGAKMILAVLNGRDTGMFPPAIAAIPGAFEGPAIVPVCKLLPKLPASSRMQLIAVLKDYPEAAARAAIVEAVGHPEPGVRKTALQALERAGDASCVPLLAGLAAGSRGAEQAAARQSLWRMRGADVDRAVMESLASAGDEAVKSELIQAAGQRRIDGIKPMFMDRMLQEPAPSRLQMIKALRLIAGPADLRGLLGLLLQLEDETGQEEMQAVVAAAALRIETAGARSAAVKRFYAAEADVKKRSLLVRVLGKIGEDGSLSIVREALADPDPGLSDAASRALSEWPTLTARDDLRTIARTSPSAVLKVLALRAFVRLVEADRYRLPEASVADLEEALALADRPEEKILVLGTLPSFACEDALRLAESLLNSEGVKPEAQAAVDRIKKQSEKR